VHTRTDHSQGTRNVARRLRSHGRRGGHQAGNGP
jgi:hypothetical protein